MKIFVAGTTGATGRLPMKRLLDPVVKVKAYIKNE